MVQPMHEHACNERFVDWATGLAKSPAARGARSWRRDGMKHIAIWIPNVLADMAHFPLLPSVSISATECALKIAAMGFIMPKKAYLRDNWNVLDFTIVVVSWISVFRGTRNGVDSIDHMFKMMRVLRPLRFINRSKGHCAKAMCPRPQPRMLCGSPLPRPTLLSKQHEVLLPQPVEPWTFVG